MKRVTLRGRAVVGCDQGRVVGVGQVAEQVQAAVAGVGCVWAAAVVAASWVSIPGRLLPLRCCCRRWCRTQQRQLVGVCESVWE